MLDGGFKYFVIFTPTWGSNLTCAYFSKGLVQPPTRMECHGMPAKGFVAVARSHRNRLEAPEPKFREELAASRYRSRSIW